MVKKALVTFLLIFVAYTVIVTYATDPNRVISEHQWQDNQIKAQDYLFSNTDSIKAVAVGSSLIERIPLHIMPNFYNLGLLGLGPFDGLFTIKYKGVYPKYIFIEINHIERELNKELTSSIDNALMTPLRKHFIPLRDGKQPMGFISIPYGQKAVAYGIYLSQTALNYTANKIGIESNPQASIYDQATSQVIAFHQKVPTNLEKQTTILQRHMAQMSYNGVQFIFFEIPGETQVTQLEGPTAIRNHMYKVFPRDKYIYIDMPDCNGYKTTDGQHLDKESSLKFAEYFKDQIEKLGIEL